MTKTYGIKEVAEMLGVHGCTVRDYIKRGELLASMVKGAYAITKEDYKAFKYNHKAYQRTNVTVVIRGIMCSFYDEANKTKLGRLPLETAMNKFPEVVGLVSDMSDKRKYHATLDTHILEHTRFDKGA